MHIQKRSNQIGGESVATSSKRQCTQTNRFGNRESLSNHNSFFENLANETSPNSINSQASRKQSESSDADADSLVNESDSNSKKEEVAYIPLVNGELEINDEELTSVSSTTFSDLQFNAIISRLMEFKEHLIRLEVKIDHYSRTSCSDESPVEIGTVDMTKSRNCGIPISSKAELNALEEKLKDDQFKNEIVSIISPSDNFTENNCSINLCNFFFKLFSQFKILKCIGGTAGKSNGAKVLEPLVHALITPTFLCSISWTGRGKGKEKKIPLNGYVNVLNLITLIMNKADKSYNQLMVEKDLKYKIIKHATTKYGDSASDQACASPASRYIFCFIYPSNRFTECI